MKSPYIVLQGLTPERVTKWGVQFANDGRDLAEGMWRRSHDEYTEKKYGTKTGDRRRRFVHFMDKYEIVEIDGKKDLAITESYIYICSTLPEADVFEYWGKHHKLCKENNWEIKVWDNKTFHAQQGDYEIKGRIYKTHPNDIELDSIFPEGYQTIEVIFRSLNENFDRNKRESPWEVWKKDYHRPTPRADARIVTDLSELKNYFPMHVELGGGPSIEAGIIPLNYFHHTYSAYSQSTGGFAFGASDTLLERIIKNLSAFFTEAAIPYKGCFEAVPTPFYHFMADMRNEGKFLEPLINNNFDGLAKIMGYKELYIRRYGRITWRPDITFDPKAKALLVVGLHSDRRLVRQHARACGLQIIIVDPEQCHDENGDIKPYPLEDVQENDLIVHMTANQFATEMKKVLAENPVSATDTEPALVA